MVKIQAYILAIALPMLLFMGAYMAVPAGIDIEVCLEADGKVDLALHHCHGDFAARNASESCALNMTHEQDCDDFIIACGDSPQLAPEQPTIIADADAPSLTVEALPLLIYAEHLAQWKRSWRGPPQIPDDLQAGHTQILRQQLRTTVLRL